MAQTKTKPKKRSAGGKSAGGSKSASRSTKSRSGGTAKAKSSSSNAKSKSRSTTSRSSTRAKSSASKRTSASKGTGGNRGKSSQGSSGGDRSVLEAIKGPATVAGAAMLAVGGGLAATKNGSKGGLLSSARKGKLGLPSPKSGLKSLKGIDLSKVDLPKPDEAIDWLEEKAKGVGDAGYRVAELTSQARGVQRAVSGDN